MTEKKKSIIMNDKDLLMQKQIGKKILEVDRLWISDLKKEKY